MAHLHNVKKDKKFCGIKNYIHYNVIMSYLLILSQLVLIIRISSSIKHVTSLLSLLTAQKVKCTEQNFIALRPFIKGI